MISSGQNIRAQSVGGELRFKRGDNFLFPRGSIERPRGFGRGDVAEHSAAIKRVDLCVRHNIGSSVIGKRDKLHKPGSWSGTNQLGAERDGKDFGARYGFDTGKICVPGKVHCLIGECVSFAIATIIIHCGQIC